jgi:general secretion pathway protein G
MPATRSISSRRCAFSLLEIVIVIVILGIISAIAIPRMSIAAARARVMSLKGDLASMNRAVELYTAEHEGLHPAQDEFGVIDLDSSALRARLLDRTNSVGASGSMFGPYLLEMPVNPFSNLATVRVDGAPAGAGTHGWRFDTATQSFAADDSVVTAAITTNDVAVQAAVKDSGGTLKTLSDE